MIPSSFLEKLSSHARHTLREAEMVARSAGAASIEPKHLLLAILIENGSLGSLFLGNAGLKKDIVGRSFLQPEMLSVKTAKPAKRKPATRLPLSPDLKMLLTRAYHAASDAQSSYVGTEHLAYSLLETPDREVSRILKDASVDEERMLDHIEAHMHFDRFPSFGKMLDLPDMTLTKKKSGGEETSFLSQYAVDLGEESISRGEELFGREEETRRLIRILCRKNKNNPLLLGEPGVGKTAIVSALARRMLTGEAGPELSGKRIFGLDLALVVAGTSFRGEFEARLKEIVREAGERDDVILFIDEIHTIVGAGNTQGGLDAANILKPALARGDIRVIGATTLSEYKRHIEKDPALDRRFQSVLVREPSLEETKLLLRKVKRSYESFHSVSLEAALLDLAAVLANRYIHDRFFPDKALDILDEASSLAKSRRAHDPAIRTAAALESARKNILNEKELLLEEGRYDDAARMLSEEKRIEDEIAALRGRTKGAKPAPVAVTEDDILETVAAQVGIPFSKLEKEHPETRFRRVGASLRSRVVHQEDAIRKIESSLLRALSDIQNPGRPLGSFLFLGPTGVGKTLIAKAVAEEFFGEESRLIRLDMSEFMERHSIAAMIGAPAGYVGYGEGGKLTERIRRNPHSVVLFDEIEKAHPDVSNLLLQILDEGTLTDAEGRAVSFRNTIIILTSNIGTAAFARSQKIGFGESGRTLQGDVFESVKNEVLEEIRKTLRPELLARIDHTVVMNALGKDAIEKITVLEFAALSRRLRGKGVTLSVPKAVIRFIAEKSFTPEHGARLVRKNIEESVEHPIASALLSRKEKKTKLALSVKDGKIVCAIR